MTLPRSSFSVFIHTIEARPRQSFAESTRELRCCRSGRKGPHPSVGVDMAASVDMHGRGVLPSHTSLPPAMSAYARPDDPRLQRALSNPSTMIQSIRVQDGLKRSIRVEVADLFQLVERPLYTLPSVQRDDEMEIAKPPRT